MVIIFLPPTTDVSTLRARGRGSSVRGRRRAHAHDLRQYWAATKRQHQDVYLAVHQFHRANKHRSIFCRLGGDHQISFGWYLRFQLQFCVDKHSVGLGGRPLSLPRRSRIPSRHRYVNAPSPPRATFDNLLSSFQIMSMRH